MVVRRCDRRSAWWWSTPFWVTSASGAKAVLTSNWGVDFNQLMKSGVETGLNVGYFTLSAHLNGGPTSMGEAGVNRVHSVVDFHENIPNERSLGAGDAWMAAFRAKHIDFDYTWINFRTMFEMLRSAVNKAGTTDALKVALALEAMPQADITEIGRASCRERV